MHDELLEAMQLDGCGFFRQNWRVALPALAFLGIFTFISVWDDHLWPLVVLVDPDPGDASGRVGPAQPHT